MAQGQGSYKVGFKRLHVGIFDLEASKVIKRMIWENENGGTVNMNITGLAPELVDMFASNKRVWMKKQGTNEVKSDMDVFNIPSDDLNAVIGRSKDKNGSAWVGENTRAPYVTVVGESEDGLTGQPVYVALLKGTFSLDSIEFKTRGEKAEAPEPTKLTGDWMNRTIDVDGTNQGIVYGYHEGKEGEEEFFKKVFVGYEGSAPSPEEAEDITPTSDGTATPK
ncbi:MULTISPECIES: major tail protein [Staphylococcus]|uniref:major tail protein n=1 Tax=Staphylococcus TaxID=1279 RepID=UPI000690C890|nr:MULTISPECIES: major tail protein [Staphylococcus]MBF2751524.1 phage tail protein [Staphylococcus saprophyticus]MDK1672719.1 phage tail protein [Staphylococcus saprophyticus]MDW3827217.1 phage tail protein [Staphylococcus saprophyticus]MDW3896884.1 phage tail protein [Staphylococcus saprophyticus]SUM89462.1 major tail protein [Staphylococcus saprophyticus]